MCLYSYCRLAVIDSDITERLGVENLKEQYALVTGGAKRVGKSIVKALANSGMNVAIHCNSSVDAAEELAKECRKLDVEAIVIQADLSQPVDASRSIFQEIERSFPHLNVLINSASLYEAGMLDEIDETVWDRQHAVNVKAPAFLCHEFAKRLPQGQHGNIINITDWAAENGRPGYLSYSVAKGGLVTLTRYLAVELAPNIRVNAIAPGAVLPPEPKPPGFDERIENEVPMKRPGTPEDISKTVLYLLNNEFSTGSVIDVTGGEHLS